MCSAGMCNKLYLCGAGFLVGEMSQRHRGAIEVTLMLWIDETLFPLHAKREGANTVMLRHL